MGNALRSAAETARDLLLSNIQQKQQQQAQMQQLQRSMALKMILAGQQQKEQLAKEQREFDRKKEFADYESSLKANQPMSVSDRSSLLSGIRQIDSALGETHSPTYGGGPKITGTEVRGNLESLRKMYEDMLNPPAPTQTTPQSQRGLQPGNYEAIINALNPGANVMKQGMPQSGQMIEVINPQGVRGKIPIEDLQKALSHGYTQVR